MILPPQPHNHWNHRRAPYVWLFIFVLFCFSHISLVEFGFRVFVYSISFECIETWIQSLYSFLQLPLVFFSLPKIGRLLPRVSWLCPSPLLCLPLSLAPTSYSVLLSLAWAPGGNLRICEDWATAAPHIPVQPEWEKGISLLFSVVLHCLPLKPSWLFAVPFSALLEASLLSQSYSQQNYKY